MMDDDGDSDPLEKASYFLDSWDLLEEPEEAEDEPETCPVRIRIIASAKSVGEMMRGFKEHARDYCEACGQTEFLGYEKPQDQIRKKAA